MLRDHLIHPNLQLWVIGVLGASQPMGRAHGTLSRLTHVALADRPR